MNVFLGRGGVNVVLLGLDNESENKKTKSGRRKSRVGIFLNFLLVAPV